MVKFVHQKSKKIEDRIKENLMSCKFRILNEKLYTSTGSEAFEYFKDNTEDFEIYHQGYTIQRNQWPKNPNKILLKEFSKKRYRNKCIADMGCGDAFLARNLQNHCNIHSFDLCKYNEYITPCDITKTPLDNSSVDYVVFCLSLMGKNFLEYIIEGRRILKNKGYLYIAEIKSRIVNKKNFLNILKEMGLSVVKEVDVKDFFYIFALKLNKKDDSINKSLRDKIEEANSFEILKPCLYKKR